MGSPSQDYWEGRQGNNRIGTPDNQRGYEDRQKSLQASHDEHVKLIQNIGKDLYWGSSVADTARSEPVVDYGATTEPLTYKDYRSREPYKAGFFETLIELIKYGLGLGLLAILGLGGLAALYETIGPEGYVLIGLYAAIIAVAVGYAWLLYRGIAKVLRSPLLRFVVWLLSFTTSAIGLLAAMNIVLT